MYICSRSRSNYIHIEAYVQQTLTRMKKRMEERIANMGRPKHNSRAFGLGPLPKSARPSLCRPLRFSNPCRPFDTLSQDSCVFCTPWPSTQWQASVPAGWRKKHLLSPGSAQRRRGVLEWPLPRRTRTAAANLRSRRRALLSGYKF